MLPVCVICLFVSLFLFSPFLFFLVLILVIFQVYPFALTHLSFPPTSIQPKDMYPMHTTLATFSNYFRLPSFSLSLPPYLSHSLFLAPSIPPSHPTCTHMCMYLTQNCCCFSCCSRLSTDCRRRSFLS